MNKMVPMQMWSLRAVGTRNARRQDEMHKGNTKTQIQKSTRHGSCTSDVVL